MMQDIEHEKKAARVIELFVVEGDVARVYLVLHRDKISCIFSDKQKIDKLGNEYDVGIQAFPCHRRLRVKRCFVKRIFRLPDTGYSSF